MNPFYEILTAAEAASLWDLDESTVRRALWQGRLEGRKSGGTHLVAMTAMREAYGPMPEHNACQFIQDNLTRQDVSAWHEDCEATPNVEDLMDAVGVECIQIWGSHDGVEPLDVLIMERATT